MAQKIGQLLLSSLGLFWWFLPWFFITVFGQSVKQHGWSTGKIGARNTILSNLANCGVISIDRGGIYNGF